MRFPERLKKGDTIGICAPSSGVLGNGNLRLSQGIKLLEELGYDVIETESVRNNVKLVSASAEVRASEFMSLYLNEDVKLIIPPYGGELLYGMLPYLDFELISTLPPKWIMGFSDTSLLLYTLTLKCGISSIHGPNLFDFGAIPVHNSVVNALSYLQVSEFTQNSLDLYQKEWGDFGSNAYVPYQLTEKVLWKSLHDLETCEFSGRLIGGCLDVICKVIGTLYAPIEQYISTYKDTIWFFESVEMNATDIYRTLLQMKLCGYFNHCRGILYGRVEGEISVGDFTFLDAIKDSIGDLNIPFLYDVDLGHLPPQLTFINGAYASVSYQNHNAKIIQSLK